MGGRLRCGTRATGEIEVYQTLSGRDLFLEPEPPLVEQEVQGGYVGGACNSAMCVGLRARRITVQIDAPTPLAELEAGLREAAIEPADVVYDLGSGDGRAAILAAVEFGARAVGLDRRPEAVELARANARRSGVEDRTRFYAVDDARADLSAATVVYVYRRPLELGPIRLRLERLPRLRLAISYRHAWPNRRASARESSGCGGRPRPWRLPAGRRMSCCNPRPRRQAVQPSGRD